MRQYIESKSIQNKFVTVSCHRKRPPMPLIAALVVCGYEYDVVEVKRCKMAILVQADEKRREKNATKTGVTKTGVTKTCDTSGCH